MIGIYQIELNGKIYVGSAVNINIRWRRHLNSLRKGKHHSKYLQNAFNKYGEDNLVFSILEIAKAKEECVPLEQKWIDKLKPEYNICPKAGSSLGIKLTEEHKQKISQAGLGRKNWLGRKHTDEEKQNLSQAGKGKKRTEETRQKMSQKQMGRVLSDETKKKIGQANLGNKYCLGRTCSEETRKKLRDGWDRRRKKMATDRINNIVKEDDYAIYQS